MYRDILLSTKWNQPMQKKIYKYNKYDPNTYLERPFCRFEKLCHKNDLIFKVRFKLKRNELIWSKVGCKV